MQGTAGQQLRQQQMQAADIRDQMDQDAGPKSKLAMYEVPEKLKLPVTIVCGPLGSGKTTLLNHILQSVHRGRFAVIESEFGEATLQTDLVVKKMESAEEVTSLESNCLCCTYREDLVSTVTQVIVQAEKLDGILIEASGTADPSAIVQTFYHSEDLRRRCRVDSVLVVTDATRVRTLLEEAPTSTDPEDDDDDLAATVKKNALALEDKPAMLMLADGDADEDEDGKKKKKKINPDEVNPVARQLAFADRILLNKTDMLPPGDDVLDITAQLREVNSVADIVECRYGKVDPQLLINLEQFSLSKLAKEAADQYSSIAEFWANAPNGGGPNDPTAHADLAGAADQYFKKARRNPLAAGFAKMFDYKGAKIEDPLGLFGGKQPDVNNAASGAAGTNQGLLKKPASAAAAAPVSRKKLQFVTVEKVKVGAGGKEGDSNEAATGGEQENSSAVENKKPEEAKKDISKSPARSPKSKAAPASAEVGAEEEAKEDEPSAKRQKVEQDDSAANLAADKKQNDTEEKDQEIEDEEVEDEERDEEAILYRNMVQNMEPEDPTRVATMGIQMKPGDVFFLGKLEEWVARLIQTCGSRLYRYKGVFAVKGFHEKFVFQGVHMLLDANFLTSSTWREPEKERVSKMVLIGKNLPPRELLMKGLRDCVVPKKLRFGLGSAVEAKVRGIWRPGKVIKMWDSQIDKETGQARSFPYRIKLDETGIEVYALFDINTMVRVPLRF
ncbi:unnamed protein product [Amoebophrya sp. A120]|nr:unnamed protein product [Amoebophrya sp. A120]|eukprot:GSA120T00003089001.1